MMDPNRVTGFHTVIVRGEHLACVNRYEIVCFLAVTELQQDQRFIDRGIPMLNDHS